MLFALGDIVETKYGDAVVTNTGYRRNSPDVDNKVNLIPSNIITMKGVDFPVVGVDDLGNVRMMFPEGEYIYEGSYVIELPVKKW